MKIEDCIYIGKVGKAKGFKGEVFLTIDIDDPEIIEDYGEVLIQIAGKLISYPIQKIYFKNAQKAVVKFDNINSDQDVELIKNKELYLPKSILPTLEENEVYLHDLVDCLVIDDELGEIGMVSGVNDQTMQRLLIIKNGFEENIIPYVEDFVYKIDLKQKKIFTKLPDGLIGVND